MASYTTKLCNSTPFAVKLNYSAAIRIRIEPFGSKELTMEQMDDLRPGKPGSAAVKSVLDTFGVFLLDVDRPYDSQALDALRLSHRARKAQYDAAHQNLISSRAASGIAPNEEALEETLKQMGLTNVRDEVAILASAIKKFEKVVAKASASSARAQFDPKRTVFVTDPPREFPSVAAMEFFLESSPEIAARHKAFRMREDGASEPMPEVSESTQAFLDAEEPDAE
jgi:hypothetical protein